MDHAAHRAIARARPAAPTGRVQRRARRRQLRRRLARAAFVLALELAAAYALIAAVRVTPSAPADAAPPALTADDVAAAPAQFRHGDVTVQGRVLARPPRVPDGDRSAFVLGGRKGGRLLVLRAQNTRGMAYTIGTLVEVRGAIVVPPTSKHLERRPASRTAIAKRMRASALVKAARVSLARGG